MSNKKLGKIGEALALKYYQNLGYELITKNFYSPYGEIDLVLSKNQKITVVEVKARSNINFFWPEESINNKKINNIWKTYQKLQNKLSLPEFFQLEIIIIEIKNQQAKIKRYLI